MPLAEDLADLVGETAKIGSERTTRQEHNRWAPASCIGGRTFDCMVT